MERNRLPDEKEMLARMPGHQPGEMPLLLHNGRFGVTMLVPKNFYELPIEQIIGEYLQPAIEQMISQEQGPLPEPATITEHA